MKVFRITVYRPFIYNLEVLKEKRDDIARVRLKEVLVIAEEKEMAIKKILTTLPLEDQKTKDILLQNGIKEYYTAEIKELEINDNIVFLS